MTSSPCLHTEAVVSRLPIHGSRLVLCRVCWAVVDPSPRIAPLRLPAPQAIPPEPAIPKPLPPKPFPSIPILKLPEEFGVPLPILRLEPPFPHKKAFFLTLVVVLPIVLWALWFRDLHYPRFQEFADPTRQYAALFPGTPIWSGGSAGGGSDGVVVRNVMGSSETYQIRVTKVSSWRFGRIKDLYSGTLAQAIRSYDNSLLVRPRPDIFTGNAIAEYEQWQTGKLVVVGRVIVMNEFAYEMTITGQNLSLDDSRVQSFFDSFQRGRWSRW
ncbi:MAG TPA: hypothetical protein VG122_10650 [Gemmata sp.]|nr:hypothetical protein [Gemmata sp.]